MLFKLARILEKQQRHAEAEPYYRHAVDAQAAGDFEPTMVGRFREALGGCLFELERYEEAESELLASHAAYSSAHGAQHGKPKRVAKQLVALYDALGRPAKADEWR